MKNETEEKKVKFILIYEAQYFVTKYGSVVITDLYCHNALNQFILLHGLFRVNY